MSGLDQEILTRLSTLPEQEQQEALDFIEFLQGKSARKLRNASYQAFKQAGLIGCIETDEQLSTTYKEKLDFSFKHGVVE